MQWDQARVDSTCRAYGWTLSLNAPEEDYGIYATACDLCGSSNIGRRVNLTGTLTGDTAPQDVSACYTCADYVINGDTPDLDLD